MADTFGQAWRAVRAHCPLAPPLLAQYWVNSTYQTVCAKRAWSWLRAESEIITNDGKTGTCTVTRGSPTVSGGTLLYATTDADRQFRVSTNAPIYTIIAATASSYTLDRNYGDTSGTLVNAVVLDAYVNMPSDFLRHMAVLDTHNNWQLRIFMTADELNAWDSQRSATGTPFGLFDRRLCTAGTFIGRSQYELWPYSMTAKNYPMFYVRKPEALTDTTTFLSVLSTAGDLLTTGGLIEAARWPGLEDRRNPYYNLQLAANLEKSFNETLDRIEVQDEEMYMTWWETVPINRWPFAPLDSRYMQAHDTGGLYAQYGAAWPH